MPCPGLLRAPGIWNRALTTQVAIRGGSPQLPLQGRVLPGAPRVGSPYRMKDIRSPCDKCRTSAYLETSPRKSLTFSASSSAPADLWIYPSAPEVFTSFSSSAGGFDDHSTSGQR